MNVPIAQALCGKTFDLNGATYTCDMADHPTPIHTDSITGHSWLFDADERAEAGLDDAASTDTKEP